MIRMFAGKCGCQTAFLAEMAVREKQNILKSTSNYYLKYVQGKRIPFFKRHSQLLLKKGHNNLEQIVLDSGR